MNTNKISRWLIVSFTLFVSNFITIQTTNAQTNLKIKTEQGKGLTKVIYQLTITPCEVPNPILKYRLDIPSIEMHPGNPIPFYLRPLGEKTFDSLWNPLKKRANYWEYCDPSKDLTDFSDDSLLSFSKRVDRFTKSFLAKAVRQSRPDWGIYPSQFSSDEFSSALLPAVQHSRQIGRAIALRIRIANRERDFDKAIEMMTIGLKLSDDIKQNPFLVSQLVGTSCQMMTFSCMMEYASLPDAPSLYFALAAKRPPLRNIENCYQLESQWPMTVDPILETMDQQDLTASQWNKKFHNIYKKFQKILEDLAWKNPTPLRVTSSQFAKETFPQAKTRLQDRGFSKDVVESMPVGQVLLLDLVHDLKYFLQQQELATYMPEKKRSQLMDRLELEIANAASQKRMGGIIVEQLHPGFHNTSQALERADWEMNALKVVEALRLHTHQTGQFPSKLDQMNWPAPRNPISGEPFSYRLEDQVAILELPAGPDRNVGIRIEIRLADSAKK